MTKHITEWLSAYLDGELRGSRLHHVEAHLAECAICLGELESLERVSSLVQQVPVPEFTPPERFAAQVSLRLPHPQRVVSPKRILEIGWWMIPVGLLGIWVFMSTSVLVNDIFSVANRFGLLTNASSWIAFGATNAADWSATLGQFGVLSGNNLSWAESTEAFTRTFLPQVSFQVSIALLYLSWIAIWWARHKRHERKPHGQLLEG